MGLKATGWLMGTALIAFLGINSASAAFFVPGRTDVSQLLTAEPVQYTRGGSRAFRRCMRAKYGPRYFHRVPRTVRFHMAQACGG